MEVTSVPVEDKDYLPLIAAKRKEEPFILLETYAYMPAKAKPEHLAILSPCHSYELSYKCFPLKRRAPVMTVPEATSFVAPFIAMPIAQLSLQQLALAAVLFPLICADAIATRPRGGYNLRQLLSNKRFATVRESFESYMGNQVGISADMIAAYSHAISESTSMLVDLTHIYYVHENLMRINVRFFYKAE